MVVWKSSKPLLLENVHYFFALNMHMKYIRRASDFVVRNMQRFAWITVRLPIEFKIFSHSCSLKSSHIVCSVIHVDTDDI